LVNNRIFTIQEVFNRWIETKSKKVKRSTVANYYNLINKWVLPIFANRFINDIEEDEISNFIRQIPLSSKTLYDMATTINCMCKFAYDEHLTNNYIHMTRNKIEQEEIEVFTEQEVKRLEHYLYANLNYINIGVLLTLYTGLRVGEVCALKWEHIDLFKGIIYIRKTLQRVTNLDKDIPTKTVIIIDEPKSQKSKRVIPIPEFFISILKQFKVKNDCYILTGREKYIEPRTLQRQFEKILSAIRIDYKNFHIIRHTFATNCYNNGMDIKVLSEILGHSSVSFTIAKYVHTNINIKRQALNNIYQFKDDFIVKKKSFSY